MIITKYNYRGKRDHNNRVSQAGETQVLCPLPGNLVLNFVVICGCHGSNRVVSL